MMKIASCTHSTMGISKKEESKFGVKNVLVGAAIAAVALPAYEIIDGGESIKKHFSKNGLKNAAKLGVLGALFTIGFEAINFIKHKNKRIEGELKLGAQSALFAGLAGLFLKLEHSCKGKIKPDKKVNKKLDFCLIGLAAILPYLVAFKRTAIDMYAKGYSKETNLMETNENNTSLK